MGFTKNNQVNKRKFKQIFTDGVALLLPILVAFYLIRQLVLEARTIIAPFAEKLGLQHVLGRFTLSILALIVIFLLTLLMGLLMRSPIIAKFRDGFEAVLLSVFPPLNEVKAMVAEVLNRENATQGWKSVILQEGSKYYFAFLVEETDTLGIFFIMKGQSLRSGYIEMLQKGTYGYTIVDSIKMKLTMRKYGAGASSLLTNAARAD